ncbi:MAG: choice-of-anchor Q domain-containing protein [Acidobacteriota bacterium]
MLARPSLDPPHGSPLHRWNGLARRSSRLVRDAGRDSGRRSCELGTAAPVVMALLTLIFASSPPLLAADIAVTTMDDTLAGPECSLRAALLASDFDLEVGGCAAGSPGLDRVLVPEGFFSLHPGSPSDDPEQTGDLDIAGPVEVIGAGPNRTFLQPAGPRGGATDRVFEVLAGGDASIRGLTIRGGRAELGGGLFVGNRGRLTLGDCRLVANEASSGGSLYAESATLTIEDCDILDNRAAAGGAIFHLRGDLTVRASRFRFNKARSIDPWTGLPGSSGGGGAVAAMGGSTLLEASEVLGNRADDTRWGGGGILAIAGNLDIVRSTLAGNSATDALADGSPVDPAFDESGGGAIGAWDASVRLVNSTLSGNEADGTRLGGGGVLSVGSDVAANHVTLWDNSADGARRAGGDLAGGSLALFSEPGSMVLGASIFAGASPAECFLGASQAIVGGAAPNAIGDGTCGEAPSIGSVTGLHPTLAGEGGFTRIHRLLPGSNAVDAGPAECLDSNGVPLLIDQRGVPRPQNGLCDLGAIETKIIPPQTSSAPARGSSSLGRSSSRTASSQATSGHGPRRSF